MKHKIKWSNLVPVAVIVFLILLLSFMTDGKLLQTSTLISLLEQSIAYIIGGLGMLFVMSMGSIDMSIGVNICVAATLAFQFVGDKGPVAMIVVCVAIGTLIGLLNGTISATFNVPSFMVTIAIQIGLRGAINAYYQASDTGRIVFRPNLLQFDVLQYKLPILIIAILLVIYLYEFSPFGYKLKAIGENDKCAHESGINVKKMKILAFTLCGAFAGLASMFVCCRVGGVVNTSGSGFEMSVMVGMFLGGIPVEGGMETKVYKMLIGLPAIVIIQSGLNIAGVSAGVYQLIQAVILLAIIIGLKYAKSWADKNNDKKMARAKIDEIKTMA